MAHNCYILLALKLFHLSKYLKLKIKTLVFLKPIFTFMISVFILFLYCLRRRFTQTRNKRLKTLISLYYINKNRQQKKQRSVQIKILIEWK